MEYKPKRKGYKMWDTHGKNTYIKDLEEYCDKLETSRDAFKRIAIKRSQEIKKLRKILAKQ